MNYRIEQLRFLLREDPDSRVFYQLAELLRREEEHSEAVEVLRRGLERHPRYVAAWVSLGRALFSLADTADAEVAFEKALELDPQNPVAARMLGETAIDDEDWPKAARALKLARELSPADTAMDEKLAFVESQLAGERAEAAPEPDDGAAPAAPSADRPADVISLSVEEPFTVAVRGDTGMWQMTQDVFGGGKETAEAEPDAVSGTELAAEPVVEPVAAAAQDAAADVPYEAAAAQPAEAGVELPAEPVAEAVAEAVEAVEADVAEPEPPEAPVAEPAPAAVVDAAVGPEEPPVMARAASPLPPAQELPLPTMTLARLAIEQGDLPLAKSTLAKLLEGDPDHGDAANLLERIGGDAPTELHHPDPDSRARAAAALQGWLDTIRLAAERQGP